MISSQFDGVHFSSLVIAALPCHRLCGTYSVRCSTVSKNIGMQDFGGDGV